MQIKSTITISVSDVKNWISKSESLHSLQSIRAKTNKRIKEITQKKEENPFEYIPKEEIRKVLKPLLIEGKNDSKMQKVWAFGRKIRNRIISRRRPNF